MKDADNKNQLQAHSQNADVVFLSLKSNPAGLQQDEVELRLNAYGPNLFPSKPPSTFIEILIRQFANPLIVVLGFVVILSLIMGDRTDAAFIAFVLLLNAIIGAVQEHGSERSAQTLRKMNAEKAVVQRGGRIQEVPAESLVPGDVVLLDSGRKVPADLRLFSTQALEIDESLLTGESLAVGKHHDLILPERSLLVERQNMAFAGSLVTKGRGRGLVVATGSGTELGRIIELTGEASALPPLLQRMAQFTKGLSLGLLGFAVLLSVYLLWMGQDWRDVLMFSIALSVSSIPEGLPVALTVALAIASRRMAKRNVIVRKLSAVESLGSCTFIATDKTGTLTVNQLTIQKIIVPGAEISVTGVGLDPIGDLLLKAEPEAEHPSLSDCADLIRAGVLCNESQLTKVGDEWVGYGDAVDLSFLVLAHKAGLPPDSLQAQSSLLDQIPFEPESQFAASWHSQKTGALISLKGAVEKVLPKCSQMMVSGSRVKMESDWILRQADQLADAGFRVLALAMKETATVGGSLGSQLSDLTFLGLVGMMDPLRPEAAAAIAACQRAGVRVAMVTGDHPKTALAISRQLGLANSPTEVVTGAELKSETQAQKLKRIQESRVFARVEPRQKLEIVRSLMDIGYFVAVTGDGANDAPALRAAHVGVAMGKCGTDVAKEASDLIVTDDRFASIVSGIEEGRIAYSNIRKVIYLLISTGTAEILMVSLSLVFRTPLPLTAVQLLWLNLVTNGIQDIGLAFEPGEGDELERPPRRPKEPIFDRLMLERVALSALVMGAVSFWQFQSALDQGFTLEASRNRTLLLMVLFENIMIGNCRSETKSAFALSPLRNSFLFVGTLSALFIHFLSMHIPAIASILGVAPLNLQEWMWFLALSSTVLLAMEIYKVVRFKLRTRI